MTTWPDVISDFLKFLKKPSRLGVFFIITIGILIAYLFPLYLIGIRLDLTIRETSSQQIATMNKIVDILNNKRIVDRGE